MTAEWFFYMVRCRDNSLYCGITNDLAHRIGEHNKGTGAKYTSGRTPVTLVHMERHKNISEARRREERVKRWSKSKKEQLAGMGFPRLRSE